MSFYVDISWFEFFAIFLIFYTKWKIFPDKYPHYPHCPQSAQTLENTGFFGKIAICILKILCYNSTCFK